MMEQDSFGYDGTSWVGVLDRYGRHATGGICSVGQAMEQDRLAIWDSFGCNRTSGVGVQCWTGMDVMEQEEFSMLDRFERERTGSNDSIGQARARWNRINWQYRTGYDILPSTTAVFSYAIGSRKLSANEQFFVGAQTVVSLLQITQIKQGVSFIAANKVYTSTNKTTIL